MTCAIEITPAGLRSLARLPREIRRRMDEKILALAAQPRPQGVKKLRGQGDLYRIRAGDYRILYAIEDQVRRIVIRKVGNRSDIYG